MYPVPPRWRNAATTDLICARAATVTAVPSPGKSTTACGAPPIAFVKTLGAEVFRTPRLATTAPDIADGPPTERPFPPFVVGADPLSGAIGPVATPALAAVS